MTIREKQIKAGRVWQVYLDAKPDYILFEGSKTGAFAYITQYFGRTAWKRGEVRIGKLIFELP